VIADRTNTHQRAVCCRATTGDRWNFRPGRDYVLETTQRGGETGGWKNAEPLTQVASKLSESTYSKTGASGGKEEKKETNTVVGGCANNLTKRIGKGAARNDRLGI